MAKFATPAIVLVVIVIVTITQQTSYAQQTTTCTKQTIFCHVTPLQFPKFASLYRQIQQTNANPHTTACTLQILLLEMKVANATHYNNNGANPFLNNLPTLAEAAPAC